MGNPAIQRAEEANELISFIVKVHDREAIGSVALKLEALGVDVERVMKRTGVLGGRGPERLLPKITALSGVKHAREEHGFSVATTARVHPAVTSSIRQSEQIRNTWTSLTVVI